MELGVGEPRADRGCGDPGAAYGIRHSVRVVTSLLSEYCCQPAMERHWDPAPAPGAWLGRRRDRWYHRTHHDVNPASAAGRYREVWVRPKPALLTRRSMGRSGLEPVATSGGGASLRSAVSTSLQAVQPRGRRGHQNPVAGDEHKVVTACGEQRAYWHQSRPSAGDEARCPHSMPGGVVGWGRADRRGTSTHSVADHRLEANQRTG